MKANFLEHSVNLLPWHARHWIKYIPLVARLQRWFFRRFLSGREFLHRINAGPAKGLLYPISLPLDKAIWTGVYEAKLAGLVSAAVNAGDVCYDIGAYRGFFSGVFALAGAGTVVAFEPFPENCAQLQRLAEVNPGLPLLIEPVAVGGKDGFSDFKVMSDSSMGKLSCSGFQPLADTKESTRVRIQTLDSLMKEGKYPAPNVVKLDVEGAEVDVLRGATAMLTARRPSLFIEAHSDALAQECTDLLGQLGYNVSVMETPEERIASAGVCHLAAYAAAKPTQANSLLLEK
jgi:FkbM family methyltransferase